MPDFERHVVVEAEPDAVFDYIADPRHLPAFVAFMTSARHVPGRPRSEIHVAAVVDGRHEEGDTRFRADRWSHSVDWGDPPHYSGSIRVAAVGDTGSRISLLLHVRDPRGQRAAIERAIEETLANLSGRLRQPG